MRNRRCAAKTCYNIESCRPNLKLFSFPKNEEACRQWAINCGRLDLLEKPIDQIQKALLCADHFESHWFLNPQYKTIFRRNCQPIPTIFQNNLADFVPKSLKKSVQLKNGLCAKYLGGNVWSSSQGCHKMCRLCARLVYEEQMLDMTVDILEKVNRLIPEKVMADDNLPHDICKECLQKVELCNKAVDEFTAANDKLHQLFEDHCTIFGTLLPISFPTELNQTILKTDKLELLPALTDYVTMNGNSNDDSNNGNQAEETTDVFIITEKDGPATYTGSSVFTNGNTEYLSGSLDDESRSLNVIMERVNESTESLVHFLNQDIGSGNISPSADNDVTLTVLAEIPTDQKFWNAVKTNVIEATVNQENQEPQSVVNSCNVLQENSTGSGKIKEESVTDDNSLDRKLKRQFQTCPECGLSFPGIKPLKRHIREEHIPEENVCQYCGAHYRIRAQLEVHMRVHTNERPYECELCKEAFHFKKALRRHKRLHAEADPDLKSHSSLTCSSCGKTFQNKASLWRHERTHIPGRSVLCYKCGKVLSNNQSLRVHMRTHSSERPCSCPHCGKSFKDNLSVSKHLITHSESRNFTCDICGKAFYSKGMLKQHSLSHSGVKPHKCDVCGTAFNRLGNLNQHKKKHNGTDLEKQKLQHECLICGKRLKSELTLKYHLAKHTGEKKPFDCGICGKRFVAIEPYRVHMRIHTGERPYVCSVCQNTFRSAFTLKQHTALHADYFPYPCPYCDRQFKRLQSLIVHRRTHTGEKPHACNICGRAFAQKGDMIKHMRTHMRVNKSTIVELDLSDTDIPSEFFIDMPIVEVETEIHDIQPDQVVEHLSVVQSIGSQL